MISVIVPIHNGEKMLRRCVDSILNSTIKDIEIILVENGSKDKTLEICNQYSSEYSNVKTIIADITGLSHARNLGISAAHGDWISFIDADDYINPFMYELLLKKAITDQNDFVFGDIIIGSADEFEWQTKEKSKNVLAREYCRNLFCIAQYMYSIVMNKLFSAKLVKGFLFDEKLRYAEDREFVFRILSKVKSIGYVETPIYYYYQGNPECISKSSNVETRIDQVYSLQKCLATADTIFSTSPEYGDYISACLLQNADFRKRRAKECGLDTQIEELDLIIDKASNRLRKAKYLDAKTKYKFLFEHDFPWLFHIAAKVLGKV